MPMLNVGVRYCTLVCEAGFVLGPIIQNFDERSSAREGGINPPVRV